MKTIVVLGPAGSNGHLAARTFFGQTASLSFCDSNLEILEKCVSDPLQNVGCVPIENSSAGLVSEVVKDYWLSPQESHLQVMGEITIPIRHCLLARPNVGVDEIRQVMSHPQALAQCRRLIAAHGWHALPAKSTSLAAQEVSEQNDLRVTAVLASSLAGEVYALTVLKEDVGDSSGNATRFHIMGSASVEPTERDRTALMFKLPNKPQMLLRALTAISITGVNISSLHSIPLGTSGEYAFYLECDFHQKSKVGIVVLKKLREVARELIILGSYPQSVA